MEESCNEIRLFAQNVLIVRLSKDLPLSVIIARGDPYRQTISLHKNFLTSSPSTVDSGLALTRLVK